MPTTRPPHTSLSAHSLGYADSLAEGSLVQLRGKGRVAAVLIVLLLFSVVAGYFQALSGMASYDDEGTLIRWVSDLLSGQPLYDRIQTPYGPLYYAYEWLAHSAAGVPVSNDSIRFVSSFFRVAAVILLFLLAYKLSGSILVSWGAAILAFGELGFLSREPAHPQELCIVLLLALALSACYTRNRTRLMLITGTLAAGMALTKINIGIFAVAAMGVAFTFSTRPTRLWSLVRVLVAAAAILLPAVLMAGMFGHPWALRYCLLETLSLAAALAVVGRITRRSPLDLQLGLRDFLLAAAAFAVALLLISAFAIAGGSSPAAMLQCLVVGPRKSFGPIWYFAPRIAPLALPWALACLALAWSVAGGRWSANRIAGLKFLLALLVLTCCVFDRPAALMSYALPLLWLVAIPHAGSPARVSFPRVFLLLIGAIQFLYAFPVAGEQMQFTEICAIAIAAVCLADALRQLHLGLARAAIPANRRIAAIVVSGLLASVCCFIAGNAVRLYRSRPSLQLPGASRIHLNPQDTRARQEIVRLARADSCATLVSIPGMPSFNVWTGVRSPVSQGGGPWILGMDEARQAELARQLSGDSHTCVVVNTVMSNLWSAQYIAYSSPMARFIRENFRTEFDSGSFRFLVRR